MRKDDIAQYLAGIDPILAPIGLRLRSSLQEWRHRVDPANELWIHINFGKSVVNPSLGIVYLDLRDALPPNVGAVTSTMIMLAALFQPQHLYTIEQGSGGVARDLQDKGLPALSQLRDRAVVIESLKKSSAADWPVPSYSHRIRLLPLLLATERRTNEALDALREFGRESVGRDQILPRYDVFVAAFVQRFGTRPARP